MFTHHPDIEGKPCTFDVIQDGYPFQYCYDEIVATAITRGNYTDSILNTSVNAKNINLIKNQQSRSKTFYIGIV